VQVQTSPSPVHVKREKGKARYVVLPQGEVYKRMPSVAEVGGRRRAARANVFDVLKLIHVGGCGKSTPNRKYRYLGFCMDRKEHTAGKNSQVSTPLTPLQPMCTCGSNPCFA
jgi:hypothetical protein